MGLLGPNGAGKTTTVKTVLGLVTPTSGEITVHGVPVHQARSRAYEYMSAVLEGARNIYWRLSVRENLAFFAGLHGIDPRERADRHEEIIDTLGLTAKADEPVKNLSRGMKQKVALGSTLARETPVLFLDEPMLGSTSKHHATSKPNYTVFPGKTRRQSSLRATTWTSLRQSATG